MFSKKIAILLLLLFSPYCYSANSDSSSHWQQLKQTYFPNRDIRKNADDLLFIEVPDKVEDAAVMPITIKSLAEQSVTHYIKTLYLIVDNNPQPYSAVFHLSPTLGAITLSTRIRMDNFSYVRVIAEMNDGSLHMVKRFVVASGGCSAPASRDPSTILSRLGKIQIRMRKPVIGKQTTVQVIISHPNANGMQFDAASRQYIPAHYVTNINIMFNNKPLIMAETGITISEDPSIRFNFTPKTSGILKAEITDSDRIIFVKKKELK